MSKKDVEAILNKVLEDVIEESFELSIDNPRVKESLIDEFREWFNTYKSHILNYPNGFTNVDSLDAMTDECIDDMDEYFEERITDFVDVCRDCFVDIIINTLDLVYNKCNMK